MSSNFVQAYAVDDIPDGQSRVFSTKNAKGSLPAGYACDMCNAKFDNPDSLEKHRSKAHKGPVGL